MRNKNFFVAKLVAVTLMLGFFSPTISIEDVKAPAVITSIGMQDISEDLFSKFSTSEFTFTLFTQAEARKKKKYKKARRKAIRRANRRANYRHHRRSERRRDALGAFVAGAVVGAVINEATQD